MARSTPGALRLLTARQAPTPTQAPLDPPQWLTPDAAAHWRRLAADLAARGALTAAAVDPLTVLCCALVRYRHATEALDRTSLLVRAPNGALTRNPLLSVQADAERVISQYADMLGLATTAHGNSPDHGTDTHNAQDPRP